MSHQDPTSPDRAPGATSDPTPPARAAGAPERRRKGGRRDDIMVPEAQFASYYGRNIVKPAPWKKEIPSYLYLGGLAAGSALLAAGGEFTHRRELQRNARLISLGALMGSLGALVVDLGKPSRFLNMMRTVKLTSPMSVGTWILTGFGGFTGTAAAAEIVMIAAPQDSWPYKAAHLVNRPMNLGAGAFAAPLAAYTAVLLANTATPTWHAAYKELPFVFVGSALAAASGAAMVTTSPEQTGPARRLAVLGGTLDLAAHTLMERRLGVAGEPLHMGRPATYVRASKVLTIAGATLAAVGGRYRPVAIVAGTMLNIGSALTRFGVFEAGIASAKDPKYTVVPQRERIEARRRALEAGGTAVGR